MEISEAIQKCTILNNASETIKESVQKNGQIVLQEKGVPIFRERERAYPKQNVENVRKKHSKMWDWAISFPRNQVKCLADKCSVWQSHGHWSIIQILF